MREIWFVVAGGAADDGVEDGEEVNFRGDGVMAP
jgi:hypothetical protein